MIVVSNIRNMASDRSGGVFLPCIGQGLCQSSMGPDGMVMILEISDVLNSLEYVRSSEECSFGL